MTLERFIMQFKEALDIDEVLMPSTILKDLEVWDSMGMIQLATMVDEDYGKDLKVEQINKCETIEQIFKLVSE